MTGLTALNAFFLTLLPLAALPVLFHLFFRLKKQSRSVSTLMFFHRIDPKLNARRRLREWLILLLRALLIALTLLCLARPVWFGVGKEVSVAVVLVIDNSGSMSGAGADGQPKLKQAVSAARNLILRLRPADRAGLVLLVEDPAVTLPPGLSADKGALKNALEQIAETDASGSAAAALDRAVTMLEGSAASHGELHILSDLQEQKWNQASLDPRAPRRGTSLVVHRIASARAAGANVSLAGAQLQTKSVLAGRRLPVEVRLVNNSAVEGRVRLNWADDAGNRGTDETVVPAQTDKTVSLALEAQPPGFRWVSFAIEGDEFPADNRAALAFFCAEKKSVLFAGDAGEFGWLPLAISPSGEGRLSGLIPAFTDSAGLASRLREQPPTLAVGTWESLAQPGAESAARWAALKQFLSAGGSALLLPAATPGPLGALPEWLSLTPGAPQGAAEGLPLAVLDKTHPMFNDLRDATGEVALHNLRAFKFRPLRANGTNRLVLGLDDGRAVLAEQSVGKGRLLASGLAFDSSWSTLPLKPGFVALAQNMALSETAAGTNLLSLVAGETLRLGAPENAALQVQALAGSPWDWKGSPARLPTLPRAGVYTVRWGSEAACVTVQGAEKEGERKFLATDTVPALGRLAYAVKDLAGAEGLVSEFRRFEKALDLSWLLLLLALAALVAEGWLANPLPLQAGRNQPATAGAPI